MSEDQKTRQQLLQEIQDLQTKLAALEKEQEQAQREQQMWETLMANTPDLVYFKDDHHGIIKASQAYAQAVGVDREDLPGKTAADLWPQQAEEILEDERKVLAGEPMIRKERQVTTATGDPRWYLLTKIPIHQDGRVIGFFAMDKDITQRKETEQALQESESRFRRIYESNMIGIAYWGESGRITDANQAYLDMIGYTREELEALQLEWKEITPQEYAQQDAAAMEQISRQGMCTPYEKEYIKKSGERVPILLGGASLEGSDQLGITFAIDITRRKQSEQALQESERQLSILMGNLPGMAYRCRNDRHWTMEFVSEGSLNLTGHHPEALIDNREQAYADLVHPEDRERVWQDVQQALEDRSSFEIEYRIISASGEIKHVWERGTGIYSNGDLKYLEGFISDITKRKQAQKQNTKRRIYLENVLQEAPDAIITLDAQHHIVEWNPGASELFGYTAEEAVGNQLDDLIVHPEKKTKAVQITQKVQQGEHIGPVEVVRYRKDGTPVQVILAGAPIILEGKMVGAIGVYTDITERVQMEEELRAMALRDTLTGLYNRRGFFLIADQQLKIANRENRQLIVLFADFDGLKAINDTYSHQQGDRALQETARALEENFRESDVIGRVGGDEFVVLALESNQASPEVLVERLQGCLADFNEQSQLPFSLAVSVGWVCYEPGSSLSLDELINRADQAMYKQK